MSGETQNNAKDTVLNIIVYGITVFAFLTIYEYCIKKDVNRYGDNDMEGIVINGLFLIGAAIAGGLVTGLFARHRAKKNQASNYEKALTEFSRQLGLNDTKTLRATIEDNYHSIINDIGRNNKSSLTQQHKDIFDYIKKKEQTQQEQFKKFKNKEKNIANSIEEMNHFFEDWVEKTNHINNQNIELEHLRQRVAQLENNNQKKPYIDSHNEISR